MFYNWGDTVYLFNSSGIVLIAVLLCISLPVSMPIVQLMSPMNLCTRTCCSPYCKNSTSSHLMWVQILIYCPFHVWCRSVWLWFHSVFHNFYNIIKKGYKHLTSLCSIAHSCKYYYRYSPTWDLQHSSKKAHKSTI